MSKKALKGLELFEAQKKALRDPLQIVSGAEYNGFGLEKHSLNYKVSDSFISLLQKQKISLLISREYENILIMLTASKGKLTQSFFPLAHPSGIAVHPSAKQFYVASTRNPNRIVEFSRASSEHKRIESPESKVEGKWMPSRVKFYPGATYLHDLAFMGEDLYANSVGFNGVFKVNLSIPEQEPILWCPPSLNNAGVADMSANYLQLNSIAAGKTLQESCFTASCEKPQSFRPGHKKFKVDGKGVVFDSSSGKVIAKGLTRPHSARWYNDKLWLCNSGYGEVGYVEGERLKVVAKLPGWTRGLHFSKDILFVGISKILPGFEHYAPGITAGKELCAVYALSPHTGQILGDIVFPSGNQIFGIESLPEISKNSFPFEKLKPSDKKLQQMFYQFIF